MGAWGEKAFDNDTACDWAYELDNVEDLSLVESIFKAVEDVGSEYLDDDLASIALAACEVLARLKGNPGYQNAYTEHVDTWVVSHRIDPPAELIRRAENVINRILEDPSELKNLWDDAGPEGWIQSVNDLRRRIQ